MNLVFAFLRFSSFPQDDINQIHAIMKIKITSHIIIASTNLTIHHSTVQFQLTKLTNILPVPDLVTVEYAQTFLSLTVELFFHEKTEYICHGIFMNMKATIV
jgi:hypothetical protein